MTNTHRYCDFWLSEIPENLRVSEEDNLIHIVSRLVNIVGRAGTTYTLKLGGRWKFIPGKRQVFLPRSPTNLDVSCGDAIVGTAALSNIPSKLDAAFDETDPLVMSCLYAAVEQLSNADILRAAPGFRPYLVTRADYYYPTPPTCSTRTPAGRAALLQYYLVTDQLSEGDVPQEVQDWLLRLKRLTNFNSRRRVIESIIDLPEIPVPPTSSHAQDDSGQSPSLECEAQPMSASDSTSGSTNPMQQDHESGDEDAALYISALQHTLRGGREREKSEHEVRGGFQKEQGKMEREFGCRLVTNMHSHASRMASAAYRASRQEYRDQIEHIRRRVEWPVHDNHLPEYGQRRGYIDEGNLHALYTGSHPFYQVTEQEQSRLVVGLLLDQSGSMSTRMKDLRNTAMILYEALSDTVRVVISGHQMIRRRGDSIPTLEMNDVVSPVSQCPQSIYDLCPGQCNYDSAALVQFNRQIRSHYPTEQAIIFLISDGEPCDSNGKVTRAARHDLSRIVRTINRETTVIGIGIANAYGREFGEEVYGAGRYVVLSDVLSSGQAISSFLINQINNLVLA